MSWHSADQMLEDADERRTERWQRETEARIAEKLAKLPPPPTDEEQPKFKLAPSDLEHDLYSVNRWRYQFYGTCICGFRTIGCKTEVAARRALLSHVTRKGKP